MNDDVDPPLDITRSGIIRIKYQSSYLIRINTMLFSVTNKPVHGPITPPPGCLLRMGRIRRSL
jgi:hypothetical protein